MPATTSHAIQLTADQYVNVSNGNLACMLVVEIGQQLRLVFGDDNQPDKDTPDYIAIHPAGRNLLSVSDLTAEDDLWVRAEDRPTTLRLMRGPAVIASIG